MYRRVNMQPNPMKDYYLKTVEGKVLYGRWLVGNSYEGWYIKPFNNDGKPVIVSQKKLQVTLYSEDGSKVKHYIPKKLLDEAFYGHKEILDFRETPDMLCYI